MHAIHLYVNEFIVVDECFRYVVESRIQIFFMRMYISRLHQENKNRKKIRIIYYKSGIELHVTVTLDTRNSGKSSLFPCYEDIANDFTIFYVFSKYYLLFQIDHIT